MNEIFALMGRMPSLLTLKPQPITMYLRYQTDSNIYDCKRDTDQSSGFEKSKSYSTRSKIVLIISFPMALASANFGAKNRCVSSNFCWYNR